STHFSMRSNLAVGLQHFYFSLFFRKKKDAEDFEAARLVFHFQSEAGLRNRYRRRGRAGKNNCEATDEREAIGEMSHNQKRARILFLSPSNQAGMPKRDGVDAFGFELLFLRKHEMRQAAQLFFDCSRHIVARSGVYDIEIFIQLDLACRQDAARGFAHNRGNPVPPIFIESRHAANRQFTDVPEQVLVDYFRNFFVIVFPKIFSAGHIKITSYRARRQASLNRSGDTIKF
ncbi:MAG: hypothetical protein AAB354_09435, partial [candidate division KSB1 bacterium]